MEQVDYGLAYLEALFDADDPLAVQRWQATFELTLENWQADRARQLLRQIKMRSLKPQEESLVRHLEGMFHVRMGDWETARKTYERALEVRRNLGDRYGELVVPNSLANLLRRGDQPLPEAMQLYQQAERIAIELQEEESRHEVLLGMGIAYYSLGAFTQAIHCLEEVLLFAQKTQNLTLEASAWHNLGSIAWTQGRLEKAQDHFQKALTFERTKQDWHGEAETLNSLGLIEEAWGDWQAARSQYEQSLEIFQRAGDLYGQVQVLVNLGNLAWLSEDLAASFSLHQQALSIATDLGDVKLEGQVLTGLGDTFRAQGQYPEAEQALQDAIQRKKSTGDERSLKHAYLSLGALYQNQKRPAEAQKAYEQALRYARQQQDQRIEAVTLINLSTLMLPQSRIEEAYQYLDAAEKIATERDYRDCLAWIAEQRGDLELFKDEPSAENLLRYFFEALAYAGDFNKQQLQKTLNNLLRFWQAEVEDGGVSETIWFCESIIQLWQETKLSDNHPEVIEAFFRLRINLVNQ
jgi:tetratricopeptide (TPR) repeat protein